VQSLLAVAVFGSLSIFDRLRGASGCPLSIELPIQLVSSVGRARNPVPGRYSASARPVPIAAHGESDLNSIGWHDVARIPRLG
jgi:hypothetical protein